jgi:uncharacterized membrane protein YhaH (DUF805 family)
MHYLFSFYGRINRAKLWLFILIAFGAWIAYFILFAMMVGFSAFSAQAHNGGGLAALGGGLLIMGLLGIVLYIAMFVASLALSTKRLHDRNKGAVWLIPFLIVPVVLNTYVFVAIFSGGLDPQHVAAVNANPVIMACRLVAVVLSIWAFVELYCLRGTLGENRFGPDPLNPLMTVERTF